MLGSQDAATSWTRSEGRPGADQEEPEVKIYTAKNYPTGTAPCDSGQTDGGSFYPRAVKCLRDDLDELLTCFAFSDPSFKEKVRTTNAIERVFRGGKRRTRPMGVFCDRTSMDRILYAVFIYENTKEGTCPRLQDDTKYLTLPEMANGHGYRR